MKNENEPSMGNVTEEKEGELEEFIDYARIIMGTLGFKVFELLVHRPITEVNQEESTDILYDESLFTFARKNGTANGQRTSEGFVVLKGSIVATELLQSCPDNIRHLCEKYANDIDPNGLLLTDLLFSSPSSVSKDKKV